MIECHVKFSAHLLLLLALSSAGYAAEIVTVKINGNSTRCEVLKMDRFGVVVKTDGKEQTLPLEVLTPKEVSDCYAQIADKEKSAELRFVIGSYYLKKQNLKDAEAELSAALKADPKLAAKIDPLLKKIADASAPATPPPQKDPPVEVKAPPPPEKTDKTASASDDDDNDPPGMRRIKPLPGESMQQAFERIMKEERTKRRVVPPRSEQQMKEFLDKRLADLNSKIGGGTWRLIETRHFYSFSNIPEAKHKRISHAWLEQPRDANGDIGIYPLLCDVLKHKEGDKLWNNKCPIYFFDKFSEFQRFGAEIDGFPGAANSGGYFMHLGREVHICIPFMTQRLGEKAADRQAKSTLYHEGTHAFLQLSGEDVMLSRWLHEGLAQFIEFWFDAKNNPERNERADILNREIRAGSIPSWLEMKQRPAGGGDIMGYAWAWTKLEFLYRNFDNQKLPTLIKLIKSGKNEEDAILEAFGQPVDKLEAYYRDTWVKEAAKKGFKFQ